MTASTEISLADEFKRCLNIMSYARAGWDYSMSSEQRANEAKNERDALARARAIWTENPDQHDALRAAFKEASPLASMSEIERTA